MRRRTSLGLIAGCLLVACGDDAPAAPPDTSAETSTGASTDASMGSTAATTAEVGSGQADGSTTNTDLLEHMFTDGTVLRVDAQETVSLWRGERRVFALRGDPKPRGLRFSETYNGLTGIWSINRANEPSVSMVGIARMSYLPTTAEIEYLDEEGETLTLHFEVVRPGEMIRVTSSMTNAFDAIGIPLDCDEGASFHGFGEQYNATDQRGEAFRLWLTEQGIGRDPALPLLPTNGDPHTTYFPMAYYLDARGFGGLFNTELPVEVDVCASDPQTAWFELRDGIDLDVFMGPTAYDVIRELGDEVGRPTQPPPWAWRPWLGMQGGQDDVAAEVERAQLAQIPFSAIWVQDWTGIRPNFDGGFGVEYRWRTDTELYPDLPGFVADLHAQDVRFLGYANPFIDPNLDHFETMSTADMLVKDPDGEDYVALAPNGLSAHPDFTAEDTAQYVQGELQAMVEDIGMDGWMADFGEWIPLDSQIADGTDPLRYHETFPLFWHAQWRAVMDDVRPDGDFAVFARSGATGVHSVAQIYWIGDQEADFSEHDGLPTVVPAMLNLGLSGIPFVTHDIAGFSGGPSTKELFMRWTELGAFTPIMRTHEGSDKDNNWRWESDEETIAHFRRFARIHEALAEEIESLAELAAVDGTPIVRALMLEFPDDVQARGIWDTYMLGPDLLVAPVVREGGSNRGVYLPAGAMWFHVWSGQAYEGGGIIEIDAPLGTPPVFSRDVDREDLRMIE